MTLDNDDKVKSSSDDDIDALELEDDVMEDVVVQKKGKKRKREEIE